MDYYLPGGNTLNDFFGDSKWLAECIFYRVGTLFNFAEVGLIWRDCLL